MGFESPAFLASGVVPVVVMDDAASAHTLADALLSGGLPVAEVTLRTPAALESIRAMAARPEMLVGAGTVLTDEQVDAAAEAGARFVVSPGLSRPVIRRARERGLTVLPGVATPSEIMDALDLGITLVKFFPASVYGGPSAVKSFGSPFSQVSFVPTGGVSADNMGDYLRLRNVAAVGGTWMVKPGLIHSGDFDRITQLSRDAVVRAGEIRGRN